MRCAHCFLSESFFVRRSTLARSFFSISHCASDCPPPLELVGAAAPGLAAALRSFEFSVCVANRACVVAADHRLRYTGAGMSTIMLLQWYLQSINLRLQSLFRIRSVCLRCRLWCSRFGRPFQPRHISLPSRAIAMNIAR